MTWLSDGKVRLAVLIPLACVVILTTAKAQEIEVQNESAAPVKVSAAEVAAMPHQRVSVEDHGSTVTFQGVPLNEDYHNIVTSVAVAALSPAPKIAGEDTGAAAFAVTAICNPH
jgi:hypothetical protein